MINTFDIEDYADLKAIAIDKTKPYVNDIEVLSLKEIGFNEEIEENGQTFEENSLIKAKAIKAKAIISKPIITDATITVVFIG